MLNINFIQTNFVSLLVWLSVVLVFIGNIRIPISGSELYVPLSIFPVVMLLLLRFLTIRIYSGAVCLIIVVYFGFISFLNSQYVSISRALAAMFPIVMSVLFIIAVGAEKKNGYIIRSAVLFGGSILALWVITLSVRALTSDLSFYEAKKLIETPLGSSNYLSIFLLAFYSFSLKQNFAYRVLALCSLIAISIYSRGGALVFILFLTVLFLIKIKKFGGLSFVVFLVLIIGSFIVTNQNEYFVRLLFFSEYADLKSTSNRFELWAESLKLIESSPFFGIGPNGFRTIVEQYGLEDVWGPHNSILLLLLNYGLIGFIFYGFYIALVLRSLLRIKIENTNYICVFFCVALFFSMFEPSIGSVGFELLISVIYLWGLSNSNIYYSKDTNAIGNRLLN